MDAAVQRARQGKTVFVRREDAQAVLGLVECDASSGMI